MMDEDGSGLPNNLEELAAIVEDADSKITECQTQQEREDAKMERYKVSLEQEHNALGILQQSLWLLNPIDTS